MAAQRCDEATTPRNIWADIGSSARWVWRQPFIVTMTLKMGAGALVYPSATLITIILAQRVGASTWEIRLIFAAFGLGPSSVRGCYPGLAAT